MKRYSRHQIEALLDKFMDGQTTVEEEAKLADYFLTHDVPAEWEDYRDMFGYFDRGMEGDLVPVQQPQASLIRLMGRRWWGIAAAAVITAAVVGTVLLHRPSTTNRPVVAKVTQEETQAIVPLQTTEQSQEAPTTPQVETQNLASPSAAKKLASRSASRNTRYERANSTRNLKAENAKLARENERLQRELADLKRRSFIIDMEANGYKAVMGEDGHIVFIDMEQEIENEFNHQSTNNIPEI